MPSATSKSAASAAKIKGMMTGGEFCELFEMIRCWEPRVRTNLLARLRAGGRLIRGKA